MNGAYGVGLAAFETVSQNLQWALWVALGLLAVGMVVQAWRDA